MTFDVVYTPQASMDLASIDDFITGKSSAFRAVAYVDRIRRACLRLSIFPERGILRDDLRPGLRVIGFDRRVAILFHVSDQRVVIDRVLYGGRDFRSALAD